MKTLKPLKLGVLTRTFELDHKHYFIPTVLVLFEISKDRRLLSEVDLWRIAGAELPKEAVLDECMPKQRGEILAHGRCFTANAVPQPAAAARIRVGSIDKTLWVVGDRTWRRDGVATDPEPFTEMPITYARAFGGEGHAQNPIGTGLAPVKEGGRDVHRLPNIELPKKLIRSKSDKPAPAGFGPYDLLWSQRWPKIGTYDAKWVREQLPGFAKDMDLTMWNAAPEDQQLASGFFEGTEEILIENMHPTKPRLEGRLPGVIGRCFVTQRSSEGDVFKEIPLRLDTVQLFPHQERGVLAFRGLAQIAEDDADDIIHLLIACDEIEAQRPIDHFRAVLERRIDPKREAIEAFRDGDLVPKETGKRASGGGDLDAMFELTRSENLFEKNVAARARREAEKTRAMLVSVGSDPDKVAPFAQPDPVAASSFDDFPAMLEKAGQDVEAAQRKMDEDQKRALEDTRKRYAAAGVDYDAAVKQIQKDAAGPPKFSADQEIERLRDIQTLCRNANVETPDLDRTLNDPETEKGLRQIEEDARDGYRLGAHLAEYRPGRLVEPERTALRERVQAAHAAKRSLARQDLCGADLSGMDLRGIDLTGAFLENALLRGVNLSGAKMARAVLSGADLLEADLTDVDFTEANLGAASLRSAKLRGATLREAILSKADLTGAALPGVTLEEGDFSDVILDGADLRRVRFDKCILKGNQLRGCDLREATFVHSMIIEVDLRSANLANAVIQNATFVRCTLDGASFLKADMRGIRIAPPCSFVGADLRAAAIEGATLRESDLSRADLSYATLSSSDLSKCILREANLYRVVAKNALFIRADLTGASLVSANLEAAILMKAKLARADFKGANLFRADLLRAVGDDKTSFAEAHVKQVRVSPKESNEGGKLLLDPGVKENRG